MKTRIYRLKLMGWRLYLANCRMKKYDTTAAECDRFLPTSERSFAYRRKAFCLQAKGLLPTGKNLEQACFVPQRRPFCTATGLVLYRGEGSNMK